MFTYKSRSCVWPFACAALLVAISAGRVSLAEEAASTPPPTPALSHDEQAEAKIRHALEQPATVEFVETPLDEALHFLADAHDIQIVTDIIGLEDVGISFDSPVTVMLKEITLRSVLRLMLREHQLTWCIDDGVLQITSEDRASERLSTKVYPVSDLVLKGKDGKGEYDTLIELLTTTIAPTSWDEVGGSASLQPYAGTFVISQFELVHEEIAQLLADLRAVAQLDMLPHDPAPVPPAATGTPAGEESANTQRARGFGGGVQH